MSDLTAGKATICIVNYKTPQLTRLCLKSIRRFTTCPHEIIVVDNYSNDGFVEELEACNWLRVIERRPEPNEAGGSFAHGSALDLALRHCRTEFFVSMHSDTFVRTNGWLTHLIAEFRDDERIASVGSGKIEMVPRWRILLKNATDLRTFKRKLLNVPDPVGKYRYYNRTFCSLYRTEILRREKLSFLMGRDLGLTCGKKLYFELLDRGYKTVELPTSVMARYVVHLAHATQVLNSDEFAVRKHTIRKCNSLVRKTLSSPDFREMLANDSLD